MADLSVLPFLFCISLSLHLVLAKKCVKLDTCSCKMDDGSGIVSLQELDSKDGVPKKEFQSIPQSTDFTFSWNPCTTITNVAACKDSNACQVHKKDYGDYPCGGSDTSFTMDKSGNLMITYKAMKYKDGHTRHSEITLSCDKSEKVGSFGSGFTEYPNPDEKTSKYTATLKSKCACPGACPHSSNYSPSTGGLSVGSILLIVFFPLLLFYFVLGIVVNKYARNKEGFPDLIPNHSFWADFPYLVKDGCVFSFQKIRYCCSSVYHKAKGDSEYAEI